MPRSNAGLAFRTGLLALAITAVSGPAARAEEAGLRWLRGSVAGGSTTITGGTGFGVTTGAADTYLVTFEKRFAQAPTVVLTSHGQGGSIVPDLLLDDDAGGVTPHGFAVHNSVGTAWEFIVFGPGLPDLTAVLAAGSPLPSVPAGTAFSTAGETRNAGFVAAAETRTRFYMRPASAGPYNGTQPEIAFTLGYTVAAALQWGTSAPWSKSLTAPSTPGDYYFFACADWQGVVLEGQETDNCATKAVTVVPGGSTLPDLVAEVTQQPPAVFVPGTRFVAGGLTRNGGTSASAASRSRMYLRPVAMGPYNGSRPGDTYAISPFFDIAPLPPGATQATNLDKTLNSRAPGDYYFFICVDLDQVVPESVETNNCVVASQVVHVP